MNIPRKVYFFLVILQCTCKFNFNSFQCNDTTTKKSNFILFYSHIDLLFVCISCTNFCLTPVCAMIREWKKCSNKYGLLQGGAGISFFLWYFYICTIPHTIFSVLSGSSCFTTERAAKNKYFTKFFTIFFFNCMSRPRTIPLGTDGFTISS